MTTVAEGTRIPAQPEPHVDSFVLNTVSGRCNILQINRRAVALADDQLFVFAPRWFNLALRLQQETAVRSVKLPSAGIAGSVLDGGSQIVNGDVARSPSRKDRP